MRGRVGVARAGGGQCAMWGGLWWAVRSLQVGVGEGARVTRAGARVHARRGAVCGASITRLLPKAGEDLSASATSAFGVFSGRGEGDRVGGKDGSCPAWGDSR